MPCLVSRSYRGWKTAAAATPPPTRSAGPGSAVRRHRSRTSVLLSLVFFTVSIQPILGFRGPHHPKSSVSHHHYVPIKTVKMTQDEQLLHDTAHLAEDMGSLANQIDVSKMNPQELEFYYFKVHDIDNNTKLDGLELLHALQHTLHGHDDADNSDHSNRIEDGNGDDDSVTDYSWIVELIDRVLEEDDLDNDGYLGYIEYVLGREKDQDERSKRDMKLRI